MKLSNFVADYLAKAGLRDVFMLTGGGSMHLNDSLGKHPQLKTTFMHHEQACAMAAEGYARLTQKPAILNITTGPGGINTLNGVFGAWTDSIPMIVISGQVRYDTTIEGSGVPALRQMGDQECDIVRMVNGITKYAVMIKNPNDILYHLEKAVFLATHGRPGPVWLDIPMNVQGANIDENHLHQFNVSELTEKIPTLSESIIQTVIEKIKSAKRPVIMVGTGVRLSHSHEKFLSVLKYLKIPLVTAFNAHDVVTENHPCYVGRPGTIGNRSGNFAVQNADLLLILGCRLNIRQISYNWKSFARSAYKIMVDADLLEMQKPTLAIDLPIHADLTDFFSTLQNAFSNEKPVEKLDWLDWCKARQKKYPVVLSEYWNRKDDINPYCFMDKLSDHLKINEIIVTANATACICAFQTLRIKSGQRLFSNSGSASMGYGLPAAIGACIGNNRSNTVCLEGDGSIMMNIQELATIAHYKLPLKIFLLNNNGYHSIRQTQQNFFGEPLLGVDSKSGVGFPNFEILAQSFGIRYTHCKTHAALDAVIADTLQSDDPVICETFVATDQPFSPKLSSKRLPDGRMISSPLEDMAPFLSRGEMKENMIVEMLPEE